MQDLEDHKIFRENGGGNLSSPIEYKEGTLEIWMPIRGIIRIMQSFTRGGGGGGGGDQTNFILTQPKFSSHPHCFE